MKETAGGCVNANHFSYADCVLYRMAGKITVSLNFPELSLIIIYNIISHSCYADVFHIIFIFIHETGGRQNDTNRKSSCLFAV